jgi:hypothetical protein
LYDLTFNCSLGNMIIPIENNNHRFLLPHILL